MEKFFIHALSHDAQGIGKAEGRVVFVPGALPGEEVIVSVEEKEKKIERARLLSVETPHPERQTPPCPVYDSCGGCALQMASPSLANALKHGIVEDAIRRIGHLDVAVEPILAMKIPYRYRNKGVFHVDDSSGEAKLGFYAKKSHQLVPANACLLFSETVNQLLAWLETAITETGYAGHVKKVMIRESRLNEELMIVFITAEAQFRLPSLLKRIAAEWPLVTSIWHNQLTNPRLMLGAHWKHLAGAQTICDAIGKQQYHLSPASFFQVNNGQADVLYQVVSRLAGLTGEETIVDLYCGIGTIGLSLAHQCRRLIGVESVRAAVEDAKVNAENAHMTNATFYAAKAEDWLPKYLDGALQKKTGKTGKRKKQKGKNIAQTEETPKIDLAIVDPPRKGLAQKLTDTLIRSAIPKIIYVSCNPATLARDLRSFHDSGYAIEVIQPVDLFPQTSHVECVAMISKE